MTLTENITFTRLRILLEILSKYTDHSIDYIRSIYEREAQYFDDIIEMANNMDILKVNNNSIMIASRIEHNLTSIPKTNQFELNLKSLLIQYLLSSDSPISKELWAFIDCFKFMENKYVWIPTLEQSQHFVGIRNMLLELGIVEYDPDTKNYFTTPLYSVLTLDYQKRRDISPKELSNALEQRSIIGNMAELRIADYERERLSKYPDIMKKVTHIAETNASAGYDILSYEIPDQLNVDPPKRFIEVKAISPIELRFYWSRNEIETARKYREQYYLYLLPIIGESVFDIEKMRIICDPYTRVFNNSADWVITCESYEVGLLGN